MKSFSPPSLTLSGLLLALALTAAAPASAAEGCVRFDGINHCPVGDAQLQLAPDGSRLIVTNLGPAADDGVASIFQSATHWEANMDIFGQYPGNRFELLAIADGKATSGLTLVREGQTVTASARFTGGHQENTFTMVVLLDGVVVGQVPGLDSSSSIGVVAGPDDDPPGPWNPGGPFDIENWPNWPPERIPFDIGSRGECVWGMRFPSAVTVSSNGSSSPSLTGDEIRLVEDVAGAGHYAYTTFDGIVTRTNGAGLTINDESISRN